MTRPKLAAFDREFAKLEAIEAHNAECRTARKGIARATRRSRKALFGILATLAVVGIVAAAVVLVQHFPAIPSQGITLTCAALESNPASIPVGGSGYALFWCTGPQSAFSVVGPYSATPTFTLPQGGVNLFLYPDTAPVPPGYNSCAATFNSVAVALTSGTATSFSSGNSAWRYCLDFWQVPQGGLLAFDLTWTG